MTNESGVLANVEPRARRTWWPSASTCAFLASGLEILWFALSLFVRSRVVESAVRTFLGLTGWATTALMVVFVVWMLLFSAAVRATALWAIGRRQRAVAPVTARLGQWAVAAYVVVSVPVFVLIVLMSFGGFGVWPTVSAHAAQLLAQDKWVFQVALFPMTMALACLGLASLGSASPWQRWASGGMLLVAIFGVFNVTTTLFGLPVASQGLWLGSLDVALRAAMWAAVGALLRSV